MNAIMPCAVMINFVGLVSISAVGQDKVFEKGTIRSIGLFRIEDNMHEEYIKDPASQWQRVMDAVKAEGLTLSCKILIEASQTRMTGCDSDD